MIWLLIAAGWALALFLFVAQRSWFTHRRARRAEDARYREPMTSRPRLGVLEPEHVCTRNRGVWCPIHGASGQCPMR